jgi:hypothetical protein
MAVPQDYVNQYNNSAAKANSQKWQNATVDDLSKKYGFDFSRNYANQQAEVEAQAKRNAQQSASRENQSLNKQTMNQIQSGLREGVVGTEHNFFNTYLQQRQAQANRGMNAGFQADQNLRLGMNQQKEMAGLYRDANLARSKESDRYNNASMTIQEAMAFIESEKLANANKMYQDGRVQGYGLLGNERDYYRQMGSDEWGRTQDNIRNYYSSEELQMAKDKFAWEKQMEAARQAQARAAAAARSKSSGSGGGGGGSTAKATGAAANYVAAFQQAKTAGGNTAADKYAASKSKALNSNQSVVRLPMESVGAIARYLPNTINPNTDKSLSFWERNKIRFGI